jgi:hypothetical protein
MRNLKFWILLVVMIICLITGVFGIDKYIRHCRRNAALNTIHAIKNAIVSEIQKDNHKLFEVNVPGDGHWYILQNTTYDSLIAKLIKHHDLDTPKEWNHSRPLLDPWGNRFRIMFYHNPNKTWGISIISNGPDRVEQTPDDLGGSSNYPYPGIDILDPNLKSPDFIPGFDRYRVVE